MSLYSLCVQSSTSICTMALLSRILAEVHTLTVPTHIHERTINDKTQSMEQPRYLKPGTSGSCGYLENRGLAGSGWWATRAQRRNKQACNSPQSLLLRPVAKHYGGQDSGALANGTHVFGRQQPGENNKALQTISSRRLAQDSTKQLVLWKSCRTTTLTFGVPICQLDFSDDSRAKMRLHNFQGGLQASKLKAERVLRTWRIS